MASVECSICFNEFRDPRVLSCGHTFCLQCIEDMTRDDRTLKCPQCRQVHAGFTTAAAMPRNVTANDLIEALQRTRLCATNANVGAAAGSSTFNDDKNANVTLCKECGRKCDIDDLIFCTKHKFCACPKCCLQKHKQCEVVDAAVHACNVLFESKISLENVQRLLDKSSERSAQDIRHNIARLKQWADAFNKALAIYERTGQLIQSRFRDLYNEVSNHRGLLGDLLTSKVNATALLYSGDWPNADKLVTTCAAYTDVDVVNLAGCAEYNILRRLGKYDKLIFPALYDELANINVDELLRQIEDILHGMETMKRSFTVLEWDTDGFMKLNKLNESHSAWTILSPPPEPSRLGPTVAACAGKMYVIGGGEKVGDTWQPIDLVQQYDTQTGWQDWPPMLEQRTGCGAAALGGRLFAVGGVQGEIVLRSAEECHLETSSRGGDYPVLRSTEECDLESGRWTHVAPMTAARCDVGVVTLSNLLFAMGGYDGSKYLNTAECYDPRAGRWTKAPPMREPRAGFGCAALGDRLYVAGGCTDVEKWTTSVEWFDLRADRWTRVRDMGAPRSDFALAALNGQLLAAGGETSRENFLDTVEVYDEKRDMWNTLDVRLPRSAWCAGCLLEE